MDFQCSPSPQVQDLLQEPMQLLHTEHPQPIPWPPYGRGPHCGGRIRASTSSLFTWCRPALEGPVKPAQFPVPQWTLGRGAWPCLGASKETACIPVPGISSQRPFLSSLSIFSFQKTHLWPLYT